MVRLRTLTPSIVVRIHAGHPAIFALPVLADFLSIDYRPVLRQEMWARANSAVLRRLGGDRHRPCQGGQRGCLRRSGMALGSGAGALVRLPLREWRLGPGRRWHGRARGGDRKSVVWGKEVSVR